MPTSAAATERNGTYVSVDHRPSEHARPIAVPKTRDTLEVMTINREKPPIGVQVIVWVGLAILLAAVGAFVWFFVLARI